MIILAAFHSLTILQYNAVVSKLPKSWKFQLGEPFEVVNYVTKYEKIATQEKAVAFYYKTVITRIQV